MMKKILFLLLFVAAFMACSDDDDNNQDFLPGNHINMIVVNEGAFTTGSAALSVIYDDGSTKFDLFQDVNGRPLGDVAQSITYIKGNYFVTLNGSKKVEVVEPQTFNSVATIVFDDEMQRLKEAVLIAARADVDALIVQNMGVARLARQLVPSMHLHASTQMSVHSKSDRSHVVL